MVDIDCQLLWQAFLKERFSRSTQAEPCVLGTQVFIEHQGGSTGADLERELFIVRKLIEREKAALGDAVDDFYICSLSNRTIVYKVQTTALV